MWLFPALKEQQAPQKPLQRLIWDVATRHLYQGEGAVSFPLNSTKPVIWKLQRVQSPADALKVFSYSSNSTYHTALVPRKSPTRFCAQGSSTLLLSEQISFSWLTLFGNWLVSICSFFFISLQWIFFPGSKTHIALPILILQHLVCVSLSFWFCLYFQTFQRWLK